MKIQVKLTAFTLALALAGNLAQAEHLVQINKASSESAALQATLAKASFKSSYQSFDVYRVSR
jgi:hypothetical protein